jgi:hypothetical protein
VSAEYFIRKLDYGGVYRASPEAIKHQQDLPERLIVFFFDSALTAA